MSAAPEPEPPTVLGRTANRVLLWGLSLTLVGAIALVAADQEIVVVVVLIAAFGLALTGLPAILFLYYASRQPPPHVPRRSRRAIYFSAAFLVLFGAWFAAAVGGAFGLIAGAAAGLTGLTTLVRVARFPGADAAGAHLVYGQSSAIGAFLVILLLIALPKFGCGCGGEDYKAKAYRAQLKSDLRNLVAAEAAYASGHHRYAGSPAIDSLFTPQAMDSMVIVARDASGFSATATHPYLMLEACGVWVGAGGPPNGGMHDAPSGVPVCWKHD